MHSLRGIVRLNDKASQRKSEDNFSRDCSFSGDRVSGIILHSAKLRNTGFLRPGAQSARFLAKWYGTNSQEVRNHIVESYF